MKTHIKNGWAALWMRVDGSSEELLAFDNMENTRAEPAGIRGSTGWSNYQIILDVSPEAAQICLGFLLANGQVGSTVLADDLALKVIPSDQGTIEAGGIQAKARNLDFEWDASAGIVPSGWDYFGEGEYSSNVSTEVFHSGASSAELASGEGTLDFRALNQCISAAAFLGKKVHLSGYLKTEDVTSEGWAGLWTRVDGKEKVLSFDNMNDRGVHGTSDWTKYDVNLDVPPNRALLG